MFCIGRMLAELAYETYYELSSRLWPLRHRSLAFFASRDGLILDEFVDRTLYHPHSSPHLHEIKVLAAEPPVANSSNTDSELLCGFVKGYQPLHLATSVLDFLLLNGIAHYLFLCSTA